MNEQAIGRRMADIRRERGLTRRELAELSRLSRGQIARLENGRQPFRSETLFRVAEALGVEPYVLFLPAGDGAGSPANTRGDYGRELTEALRAPDFVSLLEEVARAHRASPESFRAVEAMVAAVLGTWVDFAEREARA